MQTVRIKKEYNKDRGWSQSGMSLTLFSIHAQVTAKPSGYVPSLDGTKRNCIIVTINIMGQEEVEGNIIYHLYIIHIFIPELFCPMPFMKKKEIGQYSSGMRY